MEQPYQITYMHGPLNITLRMEDKTNLVSDLEEILGQCRKSDSLNAKASTTPTQTAPSAPNQPQGDVMQGQPCDKCGAKQLMSKKGNWYCSEKCWL